MPLSLQTMQDMQRTSQQQLTSLQQEWNQGRVVKSLQLHRLIQIKQQELSLLNSWIANERKK